MHATATQVAWVVFAVVVTLLLASGAVYWLVQELRTATARVGRGFPVVLPPASSDEPPAPDPR